jgi:hypothetical protein
MISVGYNSCIMLRKCSVQRYILRYGVASHLPLRFTEALRQLFPSSQQLRHQLQIRMTSSEV